jgi:hypothetical protein
MVRPKSVVKIAVHACPFVDVLETGVDFLLGPG